MVQQPHGFSDDELEKLEDVVTVFPYCALAYMLIAKGHFEKVTMLATQKLRRAATYAIDRETLKDLLLGENHLAVTVEPDTEAAVALQPVTDVVEPTDGDSLDTLVSESSRTHLNDQLLAPTTPPGERFKLLDSAEDETPPLKLGHLNEDEGAVEQFSKRLRKSVQREIIDNFIKSEPRISTLNLGEKDAFTDRDLSVSSTKPPEIISENLASILIKQGRIDKAIDMYAKLSLRFPEKSAYFASRIEDLKNL
mgnify:CR=1 FL=1